MSTTPVNTAVNMVTQLPAESARVVSETLSALNDTVSDMAVRTNQSLTKGILRKLLTTSASTLAVGFAGVLVYTAYRSYKSQKREENDPVLQQMLIDDELETIIRKSKRSPQDIEDVGDARLSSWFATLVTHLISSRSALVVSRS